MENIEILTNQGINVNKGLELLGDIEMYNEILTDFLDESEKRLVELDNYKNTEDMENYAILVHAIKGDSKYLGFDKLAELALTHEMESKSNNVIFVNNNYNELIKEIHIIIDTIKKYLQY